VGGPGERDVVSHDTILLTHGTRAPRAYLLLHGLTATPRQFADFGRRLYEGGANVYIPRMPHHGYADRLTTALAALTAQELREYALGAAAKAGTLGDELHVAGLSLGGLLAAWLGQQLGLAAVTAVAPFLGVSWIPRRLGRGAARVTLAVPNRFLWWNPLTRERHGASHGYPRFPTHAVAQAAIVAGELLAAAATTAPAARRLNVVLNARETTVSNRTGAYLAWLWSRTAPERTHLYRLRGLGASHDIIEPETVGDDVFRIYPPLVRLVGG